ncbi:hypothetical protein ONZ45_g8551 [Pleurotus djamor]|nr:hypothetical protein ONZ45_g8551 [Pleurotus djamor]
MDTGSPDLWVKDPSVKPSQVTGVTVDLTYGKGMVSGSLAFAPMTIAGFSVPLQSFVQGNQEPHRRLLEARLTIYIFAANVSLPNFFTFLLGRLDSPSDETSGVFTISEYVDGFSEVATAQKLPSQTAEHWSVSIDGVKIGGQVSSIASNQPNAPAGKAIAILDTGFSLSPAPQALVNAVYSTIPGAVQASDLPEFGTEWLIPCDQVISLSFTIGGRDFPVHPQDLSIASTVTVQGRNVTFCGNTFITNQLDPQDFNGFDLVLGDSFLRNVYVAYNYGSRDTRGQVTGEPFIQMIPTTNIEEAQNEFAAIRKKQLQSFPPLFSPAQLRAAALGQATLPSAPTTTDGTPQNPSTNTESSAPVSSSMSTEPPSADTEGEKDSARGVSVRRLFLPLSVALVVYLLS